MCLQKRVESALDDDLAFPKASRRVFRFLIDESAVSRAASEYSVAARRANDRASFAITLFPDPVVPINIIACTMR